MRRMPWIGLVGMGLPLLLMGAGPASVPGVVGAEAILPAGAKLGKAVPLFNGKDLTGWSWHSSTAGSKMEDTWSVKDGVLHSGTKVQGFIDTDREYTDFVLTVEQRHMPGAKNPENGGIFICIHGPETQWPSAVQIQGQIGNVGDLINQNASMKKMTVDPARTARNGANLITSKINKEAEKPAGEWDTILIIMVKGKLTVMVNGKLQNRAEDIDPPTGKIGLQAEGSEMEFRKVELVPVE